MTVGLYLRMGHEEKVTESKSACYCRCAYDDGSALSLQMKSMKQVLESLGVSMDTTTFYAGYGSGISSERKELVRMLTDVEKGLIDKIYIKSFDRLSRDYLMLIKIMNFLEDHNVELISIQEPEDNKPLKDEFSFIKNVLSSKRI